MKNRLAVYPIKRFAVPLICTGLQLEITAKFLKGVRTRFAPTSRHPRPILRALTIAQRLSARSTLRRPGISSVQTDATFSASNNGFDVLQWIHSESIKNLIVFVLSGSWPTEDIARIQELGAHGYFKKTSEKSEQKSMLEKIVRFAEERL